MSDPDQFDPLEGLFTEDEWDRLRVYANRRMQLDSVLTSELGAPDRSTGVAVWSIPSTMSDQAFQEFVHRNNLARERPSDQGWSRAKREAYLRRRRRSAAPADQFFDLG